MADNEKSYPIEAFDGMQVGTNRFLRKPGELGLAQNVDYVEVGSIGKKLGYTQRQNALTSTSTSSTTTTSTSSSTTTTSTSTTTTSTSTTTTSTSTTL